MNRKKYIAVSFAIIVVIFCILLVSMGTRNKETNKDDSGNQLSIEMDDKKDEDVDVKDTNKQNDTSNEGGLNVGDNKEENGESFINESNGNESDNNKSDSNSSNDDNSEEERKEDNLGEGTEDAGNWSSLF